MRKACVLLCLFFFSLTTQATTEKEWTFLLFLNGHNNLDNFGYLNLNQMERVGSTDQLNLVVQWASLLNATTKRVYVQKDDDFETVTSPIIEELPRVDMGNYQNLEEFIRWGMKKYPAKHYFVSVWNHGSGWRNLLLKNNFQINNISFDDISLNSISTKELGLVMQNVAQSLGRKIDIYGSDACLMGMVEIAAEMAGAIDYFVGSQHLEPLEGWPYTEIFSALAENPGMSPADFSKHIAEAYTKSYGEGGSYDERDVTMSALDMGKYQALAQSIQEFGAHLSNLSQASLAKINRVAWESENFNYWSYDYIDLGDFLRRLLNENITDINIDLLQKTQTSTRDLVLISKNSEYFRNATGVSIWIPKTTSALQQFIGDYRTLRFDTETAWSHALNSFIGK